MRTRQSAYDHRSQGNSTLNVSTNSLELEQSSERHSNFSPSSMQGSSGGTVHHESSLPGLSKNTFRNISILPSSALPIQTKLKINTPGDRYEKEADRVAEQVMRMPEHSVQRKCTSCGKEEEHIQRAPAINIQRKCAECEEEEMIQTKSQGNTGGMASPTLMNQIRSNQGGGRTMDTQTRSFMEPRFGADFSKVRIHANNLAAGMSQGINAKAFTVGSDIFFNQGTYNPRSSEGKKLLAHELTHTIQQEGTGLRQSNSPTNYIQRQGGSFGGFFRNIFTPDSSIDDATIQEYLTFLEGGEIEDDYDSDDKARVVVEKWMSGSIDLSKEIKVLLIKEMFSGFTGNSDERAILDLLENSVSDLTHILINITPNELREEFHGDELAELEVILNNFIPTATSVPGVVPATGPEDFNINRVDRSTEAKVFFERGKAEISEDVEQIIEQIKINAPVSVRLIGYASLDEVSTLAQDRANAVKTKLIAAPNSVTVTSAVGNAAATAKRSNFASVRNVEILLAGVSPSTLDCSETDPISGLLINPPTAPCAAMDPTTETAFNAALTIANEAMTVAKNAVNSAHADYNQDLIERFFGNSSPATLSALTTNVGNLQAHVSGLPAITRCGGQCDIGGCESGPIAYNKGVDGASKMTLCVPVFKSMNTNDQARNLIHESAHGTTPLGGPAAPTKGTKDVAYRHERILFQLSPEDRLRNSDSYALFALFAKEIKATGNPSAVPSGIRTPETDVITGITGTDLDSLNLAIAQLEKRLTWSKDHTGQLFGQAQKVRDGAIAWTDSWAEDHMKEASRIFPVSTPPTVPTSGDMTILAAIIERYTIMRQRVNQDLTITGSPSGIIGGEFENNSLQIGPDFFKATPDNQVSLLLEYMAISVPDIEPLFIPAYVSFAEYIHNNAT